MSKWPIPLNAPDDRRSFRLKLCGVTFVGFLLTVFQTCTLMILQKTVFATETTVAEPAVPHDPLGYFFAVLERTSYFLGSTATERCGEMYG